LLASHLDAQETVTLPSDLVQEWHALLSVPHTPALTASVFGGLNIITKVSLAVVGITSAGILYLAIPNRQSDGGNEQRSREEMSQGETREERSQAARFNQNGETSDTVKGIVVSVKDNWLTIKNIENGEEERYAPHWHADDSDGFNREIRRQLEKLVPGQTVEFVRGGRYNRRIKYDVKVLTSRTIPNGRGDEQQPREESLQGKTQEERPQSAQSIMNDEKSGTVKGRVISVKDHWLTIENEDTDKEERYLPAWTGGDGGTLDEEMCRQLDELAAGQAVEIGWKWDERRRVVHLKVLEIR
jgi:hypothetical protein